MSTQKKLKPNLLQVAKKQMSKFIDKINLPTEINENEEHLYHVIIVDAEFNPATLETVYKSRVQMFNSRSWTATKDRLKQIGHTNVHVFHDPTIKAKDGAKATPKKAKAKAKTGANAGAGAEPKETPKEKRDKLIAKAKELGYTGALNTTNANFEEFIKNAETNGTNAVAGSVNDSEDNAVNGGNAGDSEE